MAESQKGTSSSVDPKEKNSMLDEEIGKDFLSSWKSMSVTEDDAMDFSFDTVSNGKKKTFHFDKLDMDFNLDADFDKLSSFKVDMPDLDFSCPPKRSVKPKERSEAETSSGNHQGKKDRFVFSFDFNELDSFNFDSSLMKGEKTSNKNLDSKGAVSDMSECQSSKIQLAEGTDAIDVSVTTKLPASENVDSSKAETFVGGLGACNSIDDTCPSKSATSGNLVVSHVARTSPEKTISRSAAETDQQSCLSEKAMSTEPYAWQTTQNLTIQSVSGNESTQDNVSDIQTRQTAQNLPVQSVSGNESTRDAVSDMQTEACSLGTKVYTSSGGEQKDEMIAGVRSNQENSQWKNSSSLHIARSESREGERKMSASNTPTENVDETGPGQKDFDLEGTSTTGLLRKTLHDTSANRDVHNSTSKLPLVPSASEPIVDKLTPMKEKEASGICSRFFKKSEETGPQLCQPSLTGAEVSSFGCKRIVARHLCPENEKRLDFNANDAQIGSKLVGNAKSVSRELTKVESVLLGNEKNFKSPSNMREKCKSDGVQNGTKMAGNSRPPDKEVTKGDSVVRGSEKNTNVQVNPSSLTEKKTKSSGQTYVNPKLVISSMDPIRNSKVISGEGLKTGKRTLEFSSLRNSRATKVNKDLLNSTLQRDSLRSLEQKKELPEKTASRIAHPVGSTEKLTPPMPSLKRKTFEEPNADPASLKPLKRLSQSPSESRNFKEPLGKVVEEEVCNHENQLVSKTKNVLYDQPTSGFEITREVNMAELEIPWVMENDGNVERAEAYTKDLEDICNMLKKKHEEAKEILVRAIVNNNNLLMLNHPIHEEKIHMVQHFAARLVSKEIPT